MRLNTEHYFQEQIQELIIGLKEGLEISFYANPFYDWYQMKEIRLGLENKVDVRKYADVKIDYFTMRQIRKGLQIGIDLYPVYRSGYSAQVLRQLRRAYRNHIDLIPYVKAGYDYLQLEEIAAMLNDHEDVDYYLKMGLSGAQLSEIRLGLDAGINIAEYTDKKYNWMQMRELRLGLEKGINVSLYQNQYYDYKQMYEIRQGLEHNLDVTQYAKLRFSEEDMHNYRLFMIQNTVQSGEDMNDLYFGAMESQRLINGMDDSEENEFQIKVTDDRMHVCIKLLPVRKSDPVYDKIVADLNERGITAGIQNKELHDMIDKKNYGEWVEIATGKEATDGQDGFYEYEVDLNAKGIPTVLPDGSVDYSDVHDFQFVNQDTLIAVYHPATNGIYGYRVDGAMSVPSRGNEKQLVIGEGVRVEDNKYYASVKGRVQLVDNCLSVSHIYQHDGDYTSAMGNLKFDGDVVIKGNVESGVRICASGDIVIEKNVADTYLESDKNITIKRGVCARNKGMIKAKGSIKGSFFETANLMADGDIQANYILNSNVVSLSVVRVTGRKGYIIGGWIQALLGIETHNLGNKAYMETRVELGIGKAITEKMSQMKVDVENSENQRKYYEQKMGDMERAYSEDELEKFPMYRLVQELIEGKKNEIQRQRDDIAKIREKNKNMLGTNQLTVYGTIFPNVSIIMNGWLRRTEDESRNVTFKLDNNKVVSSNDKDD